MSRALGWLGKSHWGEWSTHDWVSVSTGYHPKTLGAGFKIRLYRSGHVSRWFFEFGVEFMVLSFQIDTW